jgi:hypothetical protein
VLEFKEHRQELMKDSMGRLHPVFAMGRQDNLWQRVLSNAVTLAHMELEVWSELLSQVKHLRKLHSNYAAAISIENDLPEEFLDALLRFRRYIEEESKGPIELLKT